MNYLYLLAKFILGGGIIVGVTVLAQHVDPKYGGILAAAPITTTLAFLFTYSEAGQATTQQLVLAAGAFAIPTLFFLLALYLLMNSLSLFPSLGGAFGIWIVCLLVMNRVISGLF
jgi:uncharacterized membrane protein (GlpM family)